MSFECSNCPELINSRQHKQSGLCFRCRKRKNATDNKLAEKTYKQKYRIENKVIIGDRTRKWQLANKDRINARRRELNREKYRTDVNFKLKCILRVRLKDAIKFNHKTGSAVRDLGCSIDHLKQYLESKFQLGMTWNNWKSNEAGWQIDHIIPLNRFDLSNRDELLKACHYTNLQPLWEKTIKKKLQEMLMSLDNFRELLLKKATDQSLRNLISFIRDDVLENNVLESLEKMARAKHKGDAANAPIRDFGVEMDPETEPT